MNLREALQEIRTEYRDDAVVITSERDKALGDFAAGPVAAYVARFRDEFQRHIDEGGCPFEGASSLEGLFAPVDQHTHAPVAEVPA